MFFILPPILLEFGIKYTQSKDTTIVSNSFFSSPFTSLVVTLAITIIVDFAIPGCFLHISSGETITASYYDVVDSVSYKFVVSFLQLSRIGQ